MGFSNRAQRFTGSNYLDVDSPLPRSASTYKIFQNKFLFCAASSTIIFVFTDSVQYPQCPCVNKIPLPNLFISQVFFRRPVCARSKLDVFQIGRVLNQTLSELVAFGIRCIPDQTHTRLEALRIRHVLDQTGSKWKALKTRKGCGLESPKNKQVFQIEL